MAIVVGVNFGPGFTGLATVGYQLYTSAGVADGSRVTAGVTEVAQGAYVATVADAKAEGFILWDTGATPALYSELTSITGVANVCFVNGQGPVTPATSIGGGSPLASGTIVSTTGTTTTLDSGAVANADYYNDERIVTLTGTGSGQSRLITAYSVARVATHAAWDVNPDATTTYEIQAAKSTATASVDTGAIADAVWDEATSGHQTAGTFGYVLSLISRLVQTIRSPFK